MLRVSILTVYTLLVMPVFADIDLIPASGQPEYLRYEVATGRLSPLSRTEPAAGRAIWSAVEDTGYFTGRRENDCLLDWGDVAAGSSVGGLGFIYYTNSLASDGDNTIVLAVYQNDNGWNSTQRQLLAVYEVSNLPGTSSHPPIWGWLVRFVLPEPFVIDGGDLDGDDLADFSYVQWYKTIATPGAFMGPLIAGTTDPNVIPPSCPGIENVFDRYADPNFTIDPNMNLNLPGGPYYVGSYWFGGDPFAQFYWQMFAPGCPEPGNSGRYCAGDIGNFNCVVDLPDLAQLLAHYGESPAAYWMGDIYPDDPERPGDGMIDLNDLAEMLAQYGDGCRGGYE